jgi:hypothetical protein
VDYPFLARLPHGDSCWMANRLDANSRALSHPGMENLRQRPSVMTFRPQRPATPPAPSTVAHGLARFGAGLTEAQSILGLNAPARLIGSLIEVAMKPGITRLELAQIMGMPLNTAMRDLKTLSTEKRNGSPGLGLVSERWDFIDRRQLRYTLTPYGEEAVSRIADAMMPQAT